MLYVLAWLLSAVATAWLGSWMAAKAGAPRWLGALVGLFGHIPGLIVLAVVDLVCAIPDQKG